MPKIGMIIFSLFFHLSYGDQVNNPVIWQDFADLDIIRVNNTFYYSASTMHYSPGAPILRSYDLVNWEYLSHSVPRLDFGSEYDLNSETKRAYVAGIWASFLNYRKSNKMFYWGGCIGFTKSFIYASPTIEGPWQILATFNKCYYDCGLLIDDVDDKMYISYAKDQGLWVAELSHDGKSEVKFERVYTPPKDVGYLEGTRFYKRNGQYYIFATHPANGQYILKAGHPFGPYLEHRVLLDMHGPVMGGGIPHQGGLVDTPTGQWYYMAFVDAYPGGRIPVIAPITWTADGWPQVQTEAGAWAQKYPFPNLAVHKVNPMIGIDTFKGKLGPQYEWNHNPDTTKFTVNNGLHLQTATVTKDLYSARNTLTHRIQGPTSTATIILDLKAMHDGDHTGLAIFRDLSASIGISRDGEKNKIIFVDQINMDLHWKTTSTGKSVATADLNGSRIWLRCQADIHAGAGKQAHFSYSIDGKTYHPFGPAFVMGNDWKPFMGYRFAVFNYATKALGGVVTVQSFEVSTP